MVAHLSVLYQHPLQLPKFIGGATDLITEQDPEGLLKAAQTYTPGIAAIDRIVRMTPAIQDQIGRGRLFTD